MNFSWTSKKPINGLRHFVLLNVFKKKEKTFFELVSVIDDEINLIVTKDELEDSRRWESGWKELDKKEAVTFSYKVFKKNNKKHESKKIYISDNSQFNIS